MQTPEPCRTWSALPNARFYVVLFGEKDPADLALPFRSASAVTPILKLASELHISSHDPLTEACRAGQVETWAAGAATNGIQGAVNSC